MKKAIPIIIAAVLLICACLFFGLKLLTAPEPVLDTLGTDLFTDPVFDPEILRYRTKVPFETQKLEVAPKANDKLTVTVSGGEELKVGENEVTITVTNSNDDTNTYKLNVERELSNVSALKSLTSSAPLEPQFSPDVTEYTASVDYFTSEITLEALPEEEDGTVEITGNTDLPHGQSVILIKSVSPSEKNVTEYKITVTREENAGGWKELAEHGHDKFVAFTFDDGPSGNTPRLLDILDKHEAKATFFVVGYMVESHADTIAEISARGHEIGNHSSDHSYMDQSWSEDAAWENINNCNNLITAAGGTTPVCFRPPGGIWPRENTFHGMNVVLWSVDPQDWKVKNKDTVRDHILSHAEDGDIILLHDLYPTSVDAADEAIGKLKEQGYVFLTVSEMLEYREYKNARE